jgi:hypothetical protein
MKKLGRYQNKFKPSKFLQLGIFALALLNASCLANASTFKAASPLNAASLPATITLNSSSTLTPALGSAYTYDYHSVSGVDSTSFWFNYCKASSNALCNMSLASQGFIANTEALSNYAHIIVTVRLSATYSQIGTNPASLLLLGYDSFSTDPMTAYDTLYSRTLTTSAQTFDFDVSSYSYSYYAIGGYTSAWKSLPSLICTSVIFTARSLTSISLSGADSIPFANNALAYPYTVMANYNDGTSEGVSSLVSVASAIDTMKLGSQTLAVTYQGFSASKEVDVSNVGASTRTLDSGALTSQDTYLYNTANLPNDASLSGRTLTFSSASNSYTGAWDIAATPRSSSEFNKFKGGYWQLGSSTASYTSLTLTSRYLYEDVTAFQVQAKKNNGGSVVVSSSIDGTSLFSSTLTTSYQTLSANLSSSPKSGRISLTFTATSGFFYFGHLSITTSGGIKAYYTPSEQANATRNFIQQFKTCPSGISDAAVIRAAKEYNAMNLDTVSGTNGKAIFKTLSETVNDYDYSDASQYSNGSYIGGSASLSGVNIYDKLSTMVKWYNKNHDTKIYLYDTTTYNATDNGGTDGYLPVFTDAAGHIVTPSSGESSFSLTLIIVAASGLLTLLSIAGVYLYSKKKRLSRN